MADLEYRPVAHDHDAFLAKALKRKGFSEAYDALEDEYLLVRELLTARARAVGCDVEIRLVPASAPRPTKVSSGPRKR
jgi:hypothetical protein